MLHRSCGTVDLHSWVSLSLALILEPDDFRLRSRGRWQSHRNGLEDVERLTVTLSHLLSDRLSLKQRGVLLRLRVRSKASILFHGDDVLGTTRLSLHLNGLDFLSHQLDLVLRNIGTVVVRMGSSNVVPPH